MCIRDSSYYSSSSPDYNLGLSVTQDTHLSATGTAKELRQPNSTGFLCDHSTSNSGSKYITTTIASGQEDPSLPKSPCATGGNPSTTSMLLVFEELEKLKQREKGQKQSEELSFLPLNSYQLWLRIAADIGRSFRDPSRRHA